MIQGPPIGVGGVRALGIAEECFPLRLPINTLGHDRPSHLGLELIHDDALCDLVDLGSREVLNPGHPLRELGDAALQVPPRSPRGHVVGHRLPLPVNPRGLRLLHNL